MISMNLMPNDRKYLWLAAAFLIVVGLTLNARPSEKEVSITTTPDSFVSPAIPLREGERDDGRLVIGITPAPWPESATAIYRAAKHGRIVHVTLVSKRATDKFDITGMSAEGNLLRRSRLDEQCEACY
jgi:hypothetical protein